jgi:hypothetical protein
MKGTPDWFWGRSFSFDKKQSNGCKYRSMVSTRRIMPPPRRLFFRFFLGNRMRALVL